MKNYERPVVVINDDLAEGVYTASGCFSITPNIHQKPEDGRGTYKINFNATHLETHETYDMLLTIEFNKVVKYVSSQENSYIVGASEGTVLTIKYDNTHYVNATVGQGIGLGDIELTADSGLAINHISLECIEIIN